MSSIFVKQIPVEYLFISGCRCLSMSIDMDDSFRIFLEKVRMHNLFVFAFDIEEHITKKFKDLTREQIFDLRLGDIWHLIGDLKIKKRY